MPASARPRRSVLYMPGSNPRALEKGRTLSADVLILDLEDAVAPDAKAAARTNIAAALAEGGYGKREILVRVNALDAPWGREDLSDLASCGADGILLPKVESADAVRKALSILDAAGGPADLAIWCMIETPMGVLHAEEIAAASPRMAGFVMGTSDLAKELHCLHTPQRLPFMTSLNHVVLVARAYGLAALDGVHLDLSDDQGFTESCQQGLELGFDGKTLIHPKTIDQANQTFGPNAQEVESSKEIIAAFEEAQSAGKGVVVLNGKLVENLHVENARRILTLAQMIEDLSTEKE
ncbi:MAG: CoA ester lyase [Rhodospirillaceae bacterium]|uniref:HpcH/HpaI aldolase/citrate lyase family protein n=1 Tax=unclassified Hwanghaeella TaxID=2605944 RepID=UPI000C394BD9|nr:CoA ester lyase [Rhodospirillales bacterium]MAX48430.1 CoA ester lyase [Rhodospirillaceae bacterium]